MRIIFSTAAKQGWDELINGDLLTEKVFSTG
jgi:hypothetical protein